MPPSKRLSRPVLEALARQDAAFLPYGLNFSDSRSTEAHLRLTGRLLADRQTSSPSSRAVAHISELFERSIPAEVKNTLACRSGCSLCCHQPVVVTAAEAFFLAAVLQLRPDTQAAMEAAAVQARDLDHSAPNGAWFACPLLDAEGNCSVYRARPTPCRAYVSINLQDCRASYLVPGSATVKEPQGYSQVRDHCRVILLAAMQANGLPLYLYEMNAAVVTALKTPNAEKRWLRGENIFSELPGIVPQNLQVQQTVAWLAQNIAQTL